MLTIDHVSRAFAGRPALRDVCFDVRPGRMTGFVGANGAGKTTAMRIILGVLSADTGRVLSDGRELTARDRASFGYMPEERGLYPKMGVREQLVYLARLHGVGAGPAGRRADDLLERLGLTERAGSDVQSLSLGNQQRAQIAAALVHDPAVLVLDEPFSGLDPMAVDVVLAVLADYAAKGAPVLFSSHQLDVVERLCDDLVVIAEGAIRAAGSVEELRERHATARWEIAGSGDMGWLRGVPQVDVVDFQGGWALFDVPETPVAHEVLRRALSQGEVDRFSPCRPSLAEIFREVTS